MVRFYTTPPTEIPYPYVLINARNPALDYIIANRKFIRAIIIDSGVEMFRDPKIKDYPKGWFNHLLGLFRRVTRITSNAIVWVTVPDYPDDYHPRALWTNGKTNIERTLDNIVYALSSYPEVNWLVPIQGHNKQPSSVIYALELYDKHDIPLNRLLAIANLCVEKSDKIMVLTIKQAHNWLMHNGIMPKIHIFGPDVGAVKKAREYIYSFDSTAWTKPRVSGSWSAKDNKERVWLFITWLYRYADIIDIPLAIKVIK